MCQPEATFGAYKAAYDLSDDTTGICAEDSAVAGNTEALALAKCVAASRNDVYWAHGVAPADADIGGFTCGLDYGATPTFPCTFDDAALYVSRLITRLIHQAQLPSATRKPLPT